MNISRKYREPTRGSPRETLVHCAVLLVAVQALASVLSREAGSTLLILLTVGYAGWNIATTKYRIDITGSVALGPVWLILTLAATAMHLILGAALASFATGFLSLLFGSDPTLPEFLLRQTLPLLTAAASVAILATGVPKRERARRLESARQPNIVVLQLWIALPVAAAFLGLQVAFGDAANSARVLAIAPWLTQLPTPGGVGSPCWHAVLTGVAFALAAHRGFLWAYERYVARAVTLVRAVYGEDYPEQSPVVTTLLLGIGAVAIVGCALLG